MNIPDLFKTTLENFKKGVKRFTAFFILTILLTIIGWIMIDDSERWNELAMLSIIDGMLVSINLAVLRENSNRKLPVYAEHIITAAVILSCYFLLNRYADGEYAYLIYGGSVAVLFSLAVYLFYRYCDNDRLLGHVINCAFYTGIMIGVVSTGLMICIFAFENLIHRTGSPYLLIGRMEVFVFVFLGLNTFVSQLPKKDSKMVIPRAYSTIINKVALVIYLLMIAILYVYFIRIIINWQMPKGEVNIFCSIALLFFCGFYLSERSEENPLLRKYLHYCGFLMLPIVIMQWIAVYIRISQYGLTVARCLSLGANIIALAFIFDSIFLRRVRWLFAFMAVIFLLMTVGPVNAIDFSNYSQGKIIETVLKKNDMFVDGSIIIRKLSEEDAEKIISAYEYLMDNKDTNLTRRQQYFISGSLKDLYGIEKWDSSEGRHTYAILQSDFGPQLKISGYDYIEQTHFSSEDGKTVIANQDVTEYLKQQYQQYLIDGKRDRNMEFVSEDGNVKICFYYVTITYDNSSKDIEDLSGNCYVLYKKGE